MHFLAIGECMAELAPAAQQGDFHLGFAGDTFNTAWYLARISPDTHVSFFTCVGADAISQQMRDVFTNSGIDDSHVQTVADRTVGLYLISLNNGERSFSYWRGQSAARLLAQDPAALATAMAAADIIYFSGITLAILDSAGRETLLHTLRTARAAGKAIAFDPNLRPRLWADTAEMTQAVMQGAAVSDIALPSFEDEADWFKDADPNATADRYAAAGATTVVVKNGGEPVHYLHGDARGTVAVPPLASIMDTTAAGDSFNAGVLAGIRQGLPLPDSIANACRIAGKVVQGKGALVPIGADVLNG
ncbi:2-dehydro-3-deoxygluconokinase [Monaibacterium marinum]|uniref:2-dehydro-3-deoxygluconokinase n=1 Tax=Pontivivens marinum TaxID=1690039 RepID=A0A2C9CXS3_9RHOB|nr:sugar kinase [Monaibacterium marinum]SOH95249.1 2-dehydro-3-deoxygluconokinase [Monaibacterium marinum]